MNDVFIYALLDPTDSEVRYVGKAKNPYKRLYFHLHNKAHTHKYFWLQSLVKQGLKPVVCVLDRCDDFKPIWEARERDWISFYKRIGCNLTNGTDGGEGLSNPSLCTRKKMSDAKINFVPWNKGKTGIYSRESINKMRINRSGTSSWNKGKHLSLDHNNKTRVTGKHWKQHKNLK